MVLQPENRKSLLLGEVTGVSGDKGTLYLQVNSQMLQKNDPKMYDEKKIVKNME